MPMPTPLQDRRIRCGGNTEFGLMEQVISPNLIRCGLMAVNAVGIRTDVNVL